MIEIQAIMSLPFLKKERFTGSCQGMQYRLEKVGEEIRATVFPGPYCFEKTDKERMRSEVFPFSQEGLKGAVDWLNRRYEEKPEEWKAGEKLL